VCCSVLQCVCVAVCCSLAIVCLHTITASLCVAVCCSVLQCVCVAVCSSLTIVCHTMTDSLRVAVCCSVLQCVCVAVCSSLTIVCLHTMTDSYTSHSQEQPPTNKHFPNNKSDMSLIIKWVSQTCDFITTRNDVSDLLYNHTYPATHIIWLKSCLALYNKFNKSFNLATLVPQRTSHYYLTQIVSFHTKIVSATLKSYPPH